MNLPWKLLMRWCDHFTGCGTLKLGSHCHPLQSLRAEPVHSCYSAVTKTFQMVNSWAKFRSKSLEHWTEPGTVFLSFWLVVCQIHFATHLNSCRPLTGWQSWKFIPYHPPKKYRENPWKSTVLTSYPHFWCNTASLRGKSWLNQWKTLWKTYINLQSRRPDQSVQGPTTVCASPHNAHAENAPQPRPQVIGNGPKFSRTRVFCGGFCGGKWPVFSH